MSSVAPAKPSPVVETSTFYCSPQLDRAGHLRANTEWLKGAIKDPNTVVVPIKDGKTLIARDKAVLPTVASLDQTLRNQLETYPWDAAKMAPVDGTPPSPDVSPLVSVLCFLGVMRESQLAVFAVSLGESSEASAATLGSLLSASPSAAWVDLRKDGPNLSAEEAGLLAYARGLLEWHSRNRCCSRCGGHLSPGDAGHTLICSSPRSFPTSASPQGSPCSSVYHPRMDPAVIMAITCGDFVLLGRQARWPKGRYSTLAGFVEVGEAFEESVVREVEEESGVLVDPSTIRYIASQPWPFPCSIMVGFKADAKSVEGSSLEAVPASPLRCGMTQEERDAVLEPLRKLPPLRRSQGLDEELEDTRWIHRDLLRSLLDSFYSAWDNAMPNTENNSAGLFIPGPYAVAHVLLRTWCYGSSGGSEGSSQGSYTIPSAEIDTGRFKYVLMRLKERTALKTRLIVRGHKVAAYHVNILERTRQEVSVFGIDVEPLGGGRIEHDSQRQTIHIYGYSQQFGQADHVVSKALVQRYFPFHFISTSDEGY